MAKDQEQTNDIEQIAVVEFDWVISDDFENHIHEKNRKWILNLKHGHRHIMPKQ